MPALKPSWEKVAQALALGESQRGAYLAGGYKYSRATAYRLCTNPRITERVEQIIADKRADEAKVRQIASRKSGVDLAWIEEHQKHVVQLALRGQPVRDKDGKVRKDPENGQVIYKPDLQAANQGLITLGRMKGAFIDRTEIGRPGDFSRLSDAEFEQKLIETAKSLGISEDEVLKLTYQPTEAAE